MSLLLVNSDGVSARDVLRVRGPDDRDVDRLPSLGAPEGRPGSAAAAVAEMPFRATIARGPGFVSYQHKLSPLLHWWGHPPAPFADEFAVLT